MSTSKNNLSHEERQEMDAFAEPVSRIVAAFASRQNAHVNEIITLTNSLMKVFYEGHTARSQAKPGAALVSEQAAKTVPALPIEDAVTKDKVFCLCCGRGFTMLKRHLNSEHGLSEEEYRKAFSLPEGFPLVAPQYSERKAAYAKKVGLGKYSRAHIEEEEARAS